MFEDAYPLRRDPYPMFIDGAWVTPEGRTDIPRCEPEYQ
jgi:hypothetical protein